MGNQGTRNKSWAQKKHGPTPMTLKKGGGGKKQEKRAMKKVQNAGSKGRREKRNKLYH